jgi:hypothetical protein
VALADLPNRRYNLRGIDFDGNEVEMVFSISKKLYRCPGCGGSIPIGAEHVLVRITEPERSTYHQHWHRGCVQGMKRTMRAPQPRAVS